MGIGTGVFLIAAGAVLFWAIDVDLPYIDDDALGLILVLAGIAVFIIAMLMKVDRPEAGIGTGIALLALGAVLVWAINADLPYIDDDALGGILMGAGALTIVAAGAINVQRRRSRHAARQPYAPQPQQPYAQDPYAQDPYAQDPYAQDRYAQDPYAQQPYGRHPQDPYGPDPYAQNPYPQDPYAQDPRAQGYPPHPQGRQPNEYEQPPPYGQHPPGYRR